MTDTSQASEFKPEYNGFIWQENLPGGAHWSGVIRRGTVLRLTDIEGNANVAMLINNQEVKNERYNMPDTLKAQKTRIFDDT